MSTAHVSHPNIHTSTTRERLERELTRIHDQLRCYREQAPNGKELALNDDYWDLCSLERLLQRVLREGPFSDGYLGNLLDEADEQVTTPDPA